MKRNSIQIIQFALGWPLSLLALFYILKFIFSKGFSLSQVISSCNVFVLILALLSFLAYFFLRGYFWHAFLQKKGHNFPLEHSLYFWSLAELTRYIPGNIWSVVSRAKAYKQNGIPIKTTLLYHAK